MQLDYAQIIAQIFGFLLVLWVMKRFAWKPILKILDDRKQKIQSELSEAEKLRAETQRLQQEYQEKLRNIDAEARLRVQDAVRDAQKIASEMREETRGEVKEMLGRARDEIERDRARALVELRNDVVNMAIRASEKILRETLDASRQRKAIAEFVSGLDKIDGQS